VNFEIHAEMQITTNKQKTKKRNANNIEEPKKY
jgi:hypothetical protein